MAVYCDIDDVRSIVSIEGTNAFIDDDETGTNTSAELAYVTYAIAWGASQIDAYMIKRYRLSDIAGSNFLKFINAVFAARNLSARRYQSIPASIAQLYDESVELLREIKQGKLDLPDTVDSFNHMPTVTNYWTQLWSSIDPVRVQDLESTGEKDWQDQKHPVTNQHWLGFH